MASDHDDTLRESRHQMADTGHESAPAQHPSSAAVAVVKRTQVPSAASSFQCASCWVANYALRCARCGGVTISSGSGRPGSPAWICSWCLDQNQATIRHPRAGGSRATAADAWAALEAHGLASGDQDAKVLGGFTIIAPSGNTLSLGTTCSSPDSKTACWWSPRSVPRDGRCFATTICSTSRSAATGW